MPKYVDHDARRQEIIGEVWRLIAAEGVDAATTRRIAEATGYSNGLLRYYFPSKDAVVTAAFDFVFAATNARASEGVGARGLEGLTALALEILPLDEERLAEARVVITFWQRSLTVPAEAALFTERTAQWRRTFAEKLGEASADGLLDGTRDTREVVDELLTMLMGAQIMAVFSPAEATPERMRRMLEAYLARLTVPAPPGR